MSEMRLILATRRSALALAQARAFARDLEGRFPGLVVDELQVVTTGDKVTDVPLAQIGGKGLFTKEIEEAIASGQAHFAVHSCKDVPADMSPEFQIACFPFRADPRDALITKSGQGFDQLSHGSRVGTSSLRRALQLKAARPDLEFVPLRGNVDTRLRKLDQGEFDAIVLAAAGLGRLGLSQRITEMVDPEVVIPAPGQGALAIQCRAGDNETRDRLAALMHHDTQVAVACERGVMLAAGGNCNVPFGAYAVRAGDELRISAMLAAPDGSAMKRLSRISPWPKGAEEAANIGRILGESLVAS